MWIGFHNIFNEDEEHYDPIIQVFMLIVANFLYLIYLVRNKPYDSRQLFLIDLFNSWVAYTISILMLYFLRSPLKSRA